tara:strand:- start:33 stop:326 length:294 start_codon:yes stop_codon:yes gene_type:complete
LSTSDTRPALRRSNSNPSVSSPSDTRPALPDVKIEKIEKNEINDINIDINILKAESFLDFLKNDTDDDVRKAVAKAVAKACGNIGDNSLQDVNYEQL